MLTVEFLRDAKSQIESAPYGAKRSIGEKIAADAGVSYSTLMRQLSKSFKTVSKKRSKRDNQISDEYVMIIAKIKTDSIKMGAAPRQIRTSDAIKIAEDAGLVPAGVLNRSTVDRRLRQIGFNSQRVYAKHEHDYVNQVWYVDHSRSELFEYAGEEGDEILLRVDGRKSRPYKNKEGNSGLERLWVTIAVDSYSRLFLVRYDVQTGENLRLITNFLEFAFNRVDSNHPMIHLPDAMQLDQGAIGKSHDFKSRLNELGIDVRLSESKSDRLSKSQSQGKVERQFRNLWLEELNWAVRLKYKNVKHITLSELNAFAHEYAFEAASKKHHLQVNSSRLDVYKLGMRQREQRTLDANINDILIKSFSRTVSATGHVTINNELFSVPHKYINDSITIYTAADGRMRGLASDSQSFDLIPFNSSNSGRSISVKQKIDKTVNLDVDLSTAHIQKPVNNTKAANVIELGAREKKQSAKSVFTEVPKQSNVITDWPTAMNTVSQITNHRWSQIGPKAKDFILELFEKNALTEDAINDVNQFLKQTKVS